MARIVLTGGSGDLGGLLAPSLLKQNHDVVNIDINPSKIEGVQTHQGSITDKTLVATAMEGADVLVHIAAWHGIHEPDLTPYDFHDLNVTGTMTVLEEAAQAGCKKVVLVSSTSVSKPYGVYGHTKILNEEMARAYSHRHGMDIVVLRPRAFIPSWNTKVYENYTDWANWFIRGAVHIDDVAQATDKAIAYVLNNTLNTEVPIMNVDGAYEYTADDILNWDSQGEGSTFKKHYGEDAYKLLIGKGIKAATQPKILDIENTKELLGYQPKYSLKNLIEEVQSQ